MTNEHIVLIMKGVNTGRVTWEEVRGTGQMIKIWDYLNSSNLWVAHRPYPPISSGFISHWDYVGKRHED